MLSHRQLLWTPVLGPGVCIVLDRAFADACVAHKPEDQLLFAQQVWRFSGGAGHVPSGFLDMHQGSLLPKGIYRGREGLWLTLEMFTLDSLNPTTRLVYHSHNADTSFDQLWLMCAFQAWVAGASVLLEWE